MVATLPASHCHYSLSSDPSLAPKIVHQALSSHAEPVKLIAQAPTMGPRAGFLSLLQEAPVSSTLFRGSRKQTQNPG